MPRSPRISGPSRINHGDVFITLLTECSIRIGVLKCCYGNESNAITHLFSHCTEASQGICKRTENLERHELH